MSAELMRLFDIDSSDYVGEMKTLTNTLQGKHESDKSISMSEVDAKIAAAEARTDTKFAEMMGELRVISGKLEHLDENYRETRASISSLKSTVIVTAVTTVLAIGGLFYTALQYGNSMFTAGLDTQTIADQSAKNALSQIQPSVDQLGTAVKNSNDRLSEIMAIFDRLEKKPPAQTTPNQ